jgi:hypothetical protein
MGMAFWVSQVAPDQSSGLMPCSVYDRFVVACGASARCWILAFPTDQSCSKSLNIVNAYILHQIMYPFPCYLISSPCRLSRYVPITTRLITFVGWHSVFNQSVSGIYGSLAWTNSAELL